MLDCGCLLGSKEAPQCVTQSGPEAVDNRLEQQKVPTLVTDSLVTCRLKAPGEVTVTQKVGGIHTVGHLVLSAEDTGPQHPRTLCPHPFNPLPGW